MSPYALTSCVRVLYDVISRNPSQNLSLLVSNSSVIPYLISMTHQAHLERISEWPISIGGGTSSICSFLTQVASVFYLPFAHECEPNLVSLVQQMYLNYEMFKHLVASLKYLGNEFLELPLVLMSRLVVMENNFGKQFIDYGGLSPAIMKLLLRETNPSPVIVDALQIVSQLARVSKQNYEAIHQADLYSVWKELLAHRDPLIRAKMCNLLGNLCKHSHYFYHELDKTGLINGLIQCCSDHDRGTRKFACFAIGNACFHNDKLYESLRPSIPALVSLLLDSEEKTRANAAGAIGNLARNSNVLCGDILKFGGLKFLFQTVETGDLATQKVALFSIGNLMVHKECKKAFGEMEAQVKHILAEVAASKDPVILKYLSRITKPKE
jgi:fused-like protein